VRRPRVAVAGVPGAWSSERLAAALRAAGAESEIIELARCQLRLPDGRLCHQDRLVDDLDGVAVKKIGDTAEGWVVQERIALLRHLEATGVAVLSEPDRLERAVNRYRMTLELARAGLPVPETVITEDAAQAAAVVEEFGTAVLKPLFTSKGRGMRLLVKGEGVAEALEAHRDAGAGPYYLQRFVRHPGRDLGIAVLDGQFLGAYWRVAGADRWMTTIHAGGRYAPADPPEAAVDLAVRAARHFGLVFTGVDLVETPDVGFAVLEVSAFGGFRGLEVACGIDAAARLAGVLLARLRTARA